MLLVMSLSLKGKIPVSVTGCDLQYNLKKQNKTWLDINFHHSLTYSIALS